VTALLRTDGIKKAYGGVQALNGASIAVDEGTVAGLIGPNGSGKTTLFNVITGYERPDEGQVYFGDKPITNQAPDKVFAAGIGRTFQLTRIFPRLTVIENMLIAAQAKDRPRGVLSWFGKDAWTHHRKHAMDLLKLVGLEGFEHYYPRQLSGGMRQRVNLARALAIDPDILLMDEPFSALDAQTREIMQTELLRIWEQGRKTVLFVTHQIDEAVFLADRVLVLARRPGRVQESVKIDLSRPRALPIKRTAEFVAYVDHIWRLIEDDVRASVIEEHA